ncbi:hypothetical protein [Streptomyces sp. NPDC102264]|uniref:hypothetical protein n=1 Tax=Streptomyces sp. NPDC102264 TaxID=3366149 RepID=UPI0037F47D17
MTQSNTNQGSRDIQAIMRASEYVRHGGVTALGGSYPNCICPKAACEGVATGAERADCPEHNITPTQALHWAAECPSGGAPDGTDGPGSSRSASLNPTTEGETMPDHPTTYFIESRPAPSQPWRKVPGVHVGWDDKAKALAKLAYRREMQPTWEHRLMERITTVTERPADEE